MKRVFLIALSICFCCQIFANNLQERRVYYLDCSYSMVKPNKIWDKVCNNLIKAIDNVEDETTELYVIPFAVDGQHHDILDYHCATATAIGKAELKKYIESLRPSKSSMTYHSDPLNDFYQNKRVANDKITYMFLMTDGVNEEKPDKFQPLLREWQSRYSSENVYGFYVMLNPSAKNYIVSSIIDSTEHLWEVETADVNINLIRFENNCTFNVKDAEYIDIPISGNINGITFDFKSNNQHYTVNKEQQADDHVRLNIKPSLDLSQLPTEEDLAVCISAKGIGQFDFLVTDKITIKCKNKKIKSIRPTFNKGKKIEKLGKVKHHPKFLWSKEQTQPLTDTLHMQFNQDAKNDKGYAEFQFVDNDGNPISEKDLHISVNGKELKDHKFKVEHTDDYVVVTFQYEPTAKAGKHQGWLRLIRHNLDQDGDTELTSQQNNSLHWQIHYEKNMNPLAKGLMWLGIFLLACLFIWFALLKPIKHPTFKAYRKSLLVSQKGQVVYNKSCQFRGARMVVFAAQKEKQSFLNRIFTGRIDTYVSPIFTQKITFVPKKHGKFGFVRAIGYTITPNPIPRSGKATIKGNNIEITLT